MSEQKMEKVQTWVSKHFKGKLVFDSLTKKIPISRLVAIAIENEMAKENPFDYDVTLPTEEYVEYAYADQAGKILNYLRGELNGFGLDMLCLLRHDIGIDDKETFLLAFRECLKKGLLESYKPVKKTRSYTEYDENYVMYRLKGESAPERVKKRREANEYSKFKKLERKYKGK